MFRHAGLVLMLQGAVVTVLGPNVARGLLFPLAYMVFLVPFGDFLEGPLQTITVAMVMPLLHLSGVPASVDGVLITTPNGYFEIAEACSGAKFVIAMIAYGVLVANVCYVAWPRRVAFLAMALVVPVIANGLRAYGTIYVAWWTSVDRATGIDHIVYGWVFFGIVMAAVLAIGWRWFDRDPDAAWFDPATLRAEPKRRADAPVAALLVLPPHHVKHRIDHQFHQKGRRQPANHWGSDSLHQIRPGRRRPENRQKPDGHRRDRHGREPADGPAGSA